MSSFGFVVLIRFDAERLAGSSRRKPVEKMIICFEPAHVIYQKDGAMRRLACRQLVQPGVQHTCAGTVAAA